MIIDINYCSRGDAPIAKAFALSEKLKKKCLTSFPDANESIDFYGAQKLQALATQTAHHSRTLAPVGGGIITASNGSFVTLVSLKDYIDFITIDDAQIHSLFEFNVRDYGEIKNRKC